MVAISPGFTSPLNWIILSSVSWYQDVVKRWERHENVEFAGPAFMCWLGYWSYCWEGLYHAPSSLSWRQRCRFRLPSAKSGPHVRRVRIWSETHWNMLLMCHAHIFNQTGFKHGLHTSRWPLSVISKTTQIERDARVNTVYYEGPLYFPLIIKGEGWQSWQQAASSFLRQPLLNCASRILSLASKRNAIRDGSKSFW